MAAGAPLIPEGVLGIAALVDLLIALLDILALGVLLGMLWTYKHSIGALIEFLVKHTTIHTPLGNVPLLFPLAAANNFIMASMSTAALGLEVAGGRFFHALGVIVGWMANLALYTATTLEHSVGWLKNVHIPRYAKWAIRAAFPLAWLTKLIAQEIAKVLPKAIRIAKGLAHDAVAVAEHPVRAIEKEVAKAKHLVAQLAHAVEGYAGSIPLPHNPLTLPKAYRDALKWLTKNEARLKRVEGLLAVGVFAGIMAQTLGVTAKCLRSGNVGKATRALCGLDSGIFAALLAGLAIVEYPISIEELAHQYLTAFDDVFKLVKAGVKEVESL